MSFLCSWVGSFQSSEVWFKETIKKHRQLKWQPAISSVVRDEFWVLTSDSYYFVWVVIWKVICRDITNTLILLFEVQAYQLEWNHSEEQAHFMRTGKTYFQMKFSLMKSTALASVSNWLTYPSPAVSVGGWGKLSTKHLIPTSIRTSLLPKIASFLWLYNLPESKYDY